MLSRLEVAIAWRYLRSRRGSRLLSFISVIAVAGVAVGVSALIVIMGVMNGLQTDLREKILVGSPDIRVLTYGESLRMERWREMNRREARPEHHYTLEEYGFTEEGLAATFKAYRERYILPRRN